MGTDPPHTSRWRQLLLQILMCPSKYVRLGGCIFIGIEESIPDDGTNAQVKCHECSGGMTSGLLSPNPRVQG